jgi:hypothetical protein
VGSLGVVGFLLPTLEKMPAPASQHPAGRREDCAVRPESTPAGPEGAAATSFGRIATGRTDTGIMIARGDLAVEVGFQRLAELQR